MIGSLKKIVEKIPYPVGRYLTVVPFELRLGPEYAKYVRLIQSYDDLSEDQKLAWVLKHFTTIFEFARDNFPFYQNLYRDAGVNSLKIRTLDDIRKVPIITKEMIRPVLNDFHGAYKLNTGGTSGKPLSFFVDKYAWAREWAHMHNIWGEKDYRRVDLKLTFRGRNLGDKAYVYNPVHNEFIINSYKAVKDIRNDLFKLFDKYDVKYFHGYPSGVYNFISQAEKVFTKEELARFFKNIKGILLGSEFPLKNQLECFKKHNLDYISWYGHSEMCILAQDISKSNKYLPFYTYGMAEVEDSKLIGTSYFNYDMPLIRYDTGDIVEGTYANNGLLEHFTVTAGREGDYVVDADGTRIPLTALIFGRHHSCFDLADCVQVRQEKDGEVELLVAGLQDNAPQEIDKLFDITNVKIKFNLTKLDKPKLSSAGKYKLKVK